MGQAGGAENRMLRGNWIRGRPEITASVPVLVRRVRCLKSWFIVDGLLTLSRITVDEHADTCVVDEGAGRRGHDREGEANGPR